MIHTTKHNAGITVVRPSADRLTAANAKAFKTDVAQLIESGAALLIVDLKGVSFVDSSGLGALVGVLKKIGYRGDLAVCGLNDDVTQMFKICRMDRVFKTHMSVDVAIEKMADAL